MCERNIGAAGERGGGGGKREIARPRSWVRDWVRQRKTDRKIQTERQRDGEGGRERLSSPVKFMVMFLEITI